MSAALSIPAHRNGFKRERKSNYIERENSTTLDCHQTLMYVDMIGKLRPIWLWT